MEIQQKKKLADNIQRSAAQGNVLVSIFIDNGDRLHNEKTIALMWDHFVKTNETFKSRFNKYCVTKDNDYPQEYVKIYKSTFEPLFLCFIKNCESKYIQMLFSFNTMDYDNICIVYDDNRFTTITIRNDREAVNQMTDMLVHNNKLGIFCHVIITE